MFSSRKRRRGAALIEFAFVGILFCGLLLGMIWFGIYLNTTNTLWNMSREGARFAAVQQAGANGNTTNNQAIIDRVKAYAPNIIDKNKLTITIIPNETSARTAGTPVTVQLSYDMRGRNEIVSPGKSGRSTDSKNQAEHESLTRRLLPSNYVTATTMMVER